MLVGVEKNGALPGLGPRGRGVLAQVRRLCFQIVKGLWCWGDFQSCCRGKQACRPLCPGQALGSGGARPPGGILVSGAGVCLDLHVCLGAGWT